MDLSSHNTIIALITIDSLRRDYVGCYGKNSTPCIDELANSSLRYDNAFSHGGGTPDSFPSILCSIAPPTSVEQRKVHGKRKISDMLKEHGFATAALHSNPYLSSYYGYDEGFDYFYDGGTTGPRLARGLQNAKYAFNQVIFNKGPIKDSTSLTSLAVDWLRTTPGPKFLWIHYMDNHFPYLPPTRYTGFLGSLRNRIMWLRLLSKQIQNKPLDLPKSTKDQIKNGYKYCIATIDQSIGALREEISKISTSRLLVLTSDHGEGFWEHDYFGHRNLYDEIIRVPLIVHGNGLAKGITVNKTVGLADVMPTICNLLGDRDSSSFGEALPLDKGEASPKRPIFCANLDPPNNTRYVCVRTHSMKYMREENLNSGVLTSEFLFDLEQDPGEHQNCNNGKGDLASSFKEVIGRYSANTTGSSISTTMNSDEEREVLQRLKALGYV